ncbi:MAG TPA: hypothetical protein PKD85_06700 [Saprospiraceae bacterium]|nr:hypothetical protein [Saprospiraceae bacterium]
MLRKITLETFDQLSCIIKQLSVEEYSRTLQVLGDSSIGQHVRHILEFYVCLSNSIDTGYVNYDARKRNDTLSTNPDAALALIEYLTSLFYRNNILNREIKNVIEYHGEQFSSNSSMEREFIYLIEHNIHHFAIINIAIKENFGHVATPSGFGVAYSTIQHKEKIAH